MGFTRVFGPVNQVDLLMWPNLKTPQNWLNTQDPAKGPPPRALMPFVNWCLRGSYFVLTLARFGQHYLWCFRDVDSGIAGHCP